MRSVPNAALERGRRVADGNPPADTASAVLRSKGPKALNGGRFMADRIANHSSVALWVVEIGPASKRPTAHLLQPGRETPKGIKVLGVRTANGQPLLLQ